jgi:hypothetical protein
MTHLEKQRKWLINQSSLQRDELELYIDNLRQPLHSLDNGIKILSFVSTHSVLMFTTTFLLNRLRNRFIAKWLNKLTIIKSVVRVIRRIV